MIASVVVGVLALKVPDHRSESVIILGLGGFLIFGLGPTLAASALRKSDAWATDWRFNLTLAITGVQTISQLIKDRKKGNARAETHPGTSG